MVSLEQFKTEQGYVCPQDGTTKKTTRGNCKSSKSISKKDGEHRGNLRAPGDGDSKGPTRKEGRQGSGEENRRELK